MAYNVFGNPITDITLKGMPEYATKSISRLDRAHVALNMRNAADKNQNARTYVEKLKQQWGDGVSTLCLVYNATGDNVNYIMDHNWYGHIGPSPYPQDIANGQWGGFLHVKTSGVASGSAGAVVYRGKDAIGFDYDWLLSWSNPWNRLDFDNTVYTEIREAGHYQQSDHWELLSHKLYGSGIHSNDIYNGCSSNVITGNGTTVVLEGIMTLENA